MNDALCEHIVARKSKPMDFVIRVLIIVVIVAIAIGGMPCLGFFAFALAAILALLAYYFAFPLLNVEYEYSLLNHDLEIDAIYSKEKRKSKMMFFHQYCNIQNAEIIAPKGSHRLNSYHPETTCDFSSGNANAKVFAIMIPINQKMTCVYIEPDEKMIEHMKQWMGMKMFVD